MDQKIKILIVDGQPALRGGIVHAMAANPVLDVVGEAATGALAIKLAGELAPDVVVLDVQLPDMDGLEVSRLIMSAHPAMKLVVFSADVTRATVEQALRIGVCGYLSKASAVEELLQAIGWVMDGRLYLSADASADIVAEYRKGLTDGPASAKPFLSERQEQLLRLIAGGRRNKEIAVQLAISIKSVEANRSRLMKKLGCASLADLVRYAIREGIAAL
jgi:DNA-binding NarL/FixJ family response regulator